MMSFTLFGYIHHVMGCYCLALCLEAFSQVPDQAWNLEKDTSSDGRPHLI